MREGFRQWLADATGCNIQSGAVKGKEKDSGWPCGTCTIDILSKIGLTPKVEAYHDRDKKNVDRANEVWRAILQIREAKIK